MTTAIIKPQWGPLTIALMVLGFIVFWPLGVAMLAYILWGELFGGSQEKAEAWMNKSKAWCRENKGHHGSYSRWQQSSGNAAFECCNALFKHIGGRVHQAGVNISQLFKREQIRGVFSVLELIARCLVQRHGAAASGGIGGIACM